MRRTLRKWPSPDYGAGSVRRRNRNTRRGSPGTAANAREARVLARLTDPAIVRVYDLAETEVGLMMVLEYVQGPNFAQVLDARLRLTEPELIRSMRQICTGLAVAHQAGVIHRDLKPPNLLVAPGQARLPYDDPAFLMQAQIKITDFGISKFAANKVSTPDGTMRATDATQSAAGTPYYMAPEQFRGQPCTPASDVYSLGIIAYQALTGSPPFMGPDIPAIAHQHFSATAPAIPGCTLQTNNTIQKALAKDPATRFQTALQFLAALEEAPVLVATDAGDRAAEWLSRNKWRLALAAVALVGLLLVGLVTFQMCHRSPRFRPLRRKWRRILEPSSRCLLTSIRRPLCKLLPSPFRILRHRRERSSERVASFGPASYPLNARPS